MNRINNSYGNRKRGTARRPNSHRARRRSGITVGCVIRRILLLLFTLLLMIIISVFALCAVVANGPSPTVRNLLVLSALQASATKWVPGLFLPEETVSEIYEASMVVSVDEIDMSDYISGSITEPDPQTGELADEWADYPDGIQLKFISGSTYKAYLLIVKDPSRVYVSCVSNMGTASYGMQIFTGAERDGAVAGINGGEFADLNGMGSGALPTGLTYSLGECVWDDGLKRTFMGFDSENNLIVSENMTRTEADNLGIRDAVSFKTGNLLISHDGEKVKLHYSDGNNGTAQRTAIGQRADGAVLLLVTDGRSASSLGATHNDVIDIMVTYGAVTAGMLDGGSSSMMYYKDYYKLYDIDESTLDQYQKRGMVNKYKAFTAPRYIPTYFMVK